MAERVKEKVRCANRATRTIVLVICKTLQFQFSHHHTHFHANGENHLVNRFQINSNILSDKQCTATFVDNEGNKYLNNVAVKIDENTFVFGHTHSGYLKMVGVDSAGKKTQARYQVAGDGVVTNQKWESGIVTGVNYNVEDVRMDCIGTEL